MKDNLEEIKQLGYRVVAVSQQYGYIVRKDGKFLEYGLAKYTSNGGIYFTYAYKPSRTQGSGAVQGEEDVYNFGYKEFSNKMIDKMMDFPRVYGKVERYNDFREFCKCKSRHCGLLKRYC